MSSVWMRTIALMVIVCQLSSTGCKKGDADATGVPAPDFSSPEGALLTYLRALRAGDTVGAMNAVTADAHSQRAARILSTWMGGFREANDALRARQLPDVTALGLDERIPVADWRADVDKSIQATFGVARTSDTGATVHALEGDTTRYYVRKDSGLWKVDLSQEQQVLNTMDDRGFGYRALAKAVNGGTIHTADEAKAYYLKVGRERYGIE